MSTAVFVAKMIQYIESELNALPLGPGSKSNLKKALAKELSSPHPVGPRNVVMKIPKESVEKLRLLGFEEITADTILSLISLPENSTTRWWANYNFAKCLGDGRGWTVGIFGACSGTGDLLLIMEELEKNNPNHCLCKYIRPMKKCIGDDVTGLEDLGKDIIGLGDDDDWQNATWHVYIKLYWSFAKDMADKTGFCSKRPGPKMTTAATRGFLVDVVINHGPSMGGINPIIRRMRNRAETNEFGWILDFCQARKSLLKAGYQSLDSSKTGDRCTLWSSIIESGNTSLSRPIAVLPGYWNHRSTILS